MIPLLQVALPDATTFVSDAVAPVMGEIFTKFIPIASAVSIGFFAVRKLSGGK